MKKTVDLEKNTICYRFPKNYVVDWKRKRRNIKIHILVTYLSIPVIIGGLEVFFYFGFEDKFRELPIFYQVVVHFSIVVLAWEGFMSDYKNHYDVKRIYESYFTKQVLIDGYELVITRIFEDGKEEQVVFNIQVLKIELIEVKGGPYCLILSSRKPDRKHILICEGDWEWSSIKEIQKEIKARQKKARQLTTR